MTVKKSGLPEPEGNYRHFNYSLSGEFLMKDDCDILDYFVFTFVRNPWERAVSWANMIFIIYNTEINRLLLQTAVERTLSPQYKQASYYTKPLKQVHQTTRTVDYIGSLENHETDLREVSALLGLKLDLEPPTFSRKSYHKEISKFWDSELSGRIEGGEAETIAMMGYKNPY